MSANSLLPKLQEHIPLLCYSLIRPIVGRNLDSNHMASLVSYRVSTSQLDNVGHPARTSRMLRGAPHCSQHRFLPPVDTRPSARPKLWLFAIREGGPSGLFVNPARSPPSIGHSSINYRHLTGHWGTSRFPRWFIDLIGIGQPVKISDALVSWPSLILVGKGLTHLSSC